MNTLERLAESEAMRRYDKLKAEGKIIRSVGIDDSDRQKPD